MACSKKYGPGAVYVVKESTFGSYVTIAAADAISCQAATIGALTRDKLDNTALRQDRGQNAQFDGAQAEITWELSFTIPQISVLVASYPGAISALLWGLGKENAAGTLTPGAICGRTLQITRADRDGGLVEILNGCLVQQAVWTYSCSEMPTLVFSGVAAKKTELFGGLLLNDNDVDITTSTTTLALDDDYLPQPRCSDVLMGVSSDITLPGGLGINVGGTALTCSEIAVTCDDDKSIDFTFTAPSAAITDATSVTWTLPAPANSSNFVPVTPSSWTVQLNSTPVPVKSCTFTVESGLSFGDLVANTATPSQILSGTTKVTGSISAYLDNETLSAFSATSYTLELRHGTGNGKITLANGVITEHPSYELSVDDAASGDFSLQFAPASHSNFNAITFATYSDSLATS